MYYLYHIKGVKWGCSNQLKIRLKKQGYTLNDVYEIIEETNIDKAADMEKQLNIRDGYKWRDDQDYRIITKAAIIGGNIVGKERGKLNVLSGHLKNIHHLSLTKEARLKAVNNTNWYSVSKKLQKPIIAYKKDTNQFVGEYPSIKLAAELLNIGSANICNVLKNRYKQYKGYTFNYKS
jgi:hypothetical protein